MFDGRKVRANKLYQLVYLDSLSNYQKSALTTALTDNTKALMMPIDRVPLGIITVSDECEVLIRNYAKGKYLSDTSQSDYIKQLILCGILEIETKAGYRFGPSALADVEGLEQDDNSLDFLSSLSCTAIKLVSYLAIPDLTRLSARLYFYNREPAFRKHAAFKLAEDISACHQKWHRKKGHKDFKKIITTSQGSWLFYAAKYRSRQTEGSGGHKLYLSPRSTHTVQALRLLLNRISEADLIGFKVGLELKDFYRPDKIVLYFSEEKALLDFVKLIRPAFDEIEVQGLPFTSPLCKSGLFSRGIDPPNSVHILKWKEKESWRLWLCNRIASAILIEKAQKTQVAYPIWKSVLYYLEQIGVNTQTWQPHHDFSFKEAI